MRLRNRAFGLAQLTVAAALVALAVREANGFWVALGGLNFAIAVYSTARGVLPQPKREASGPADDHALLAVPNTWQSRWIGAVLEQLGDGVVIADRFGKILMVNQAAERFLGIEPHDAAPGDWASRYGIFLPDMVTPCPADQVPLARAIRGESVDNVELFVKCLGGSGNCWVSVTARPIRGEWGTLEGGVVTIRDTTNAKRSETNLVRSHEQLKDRLREQTAELQALMEAVPAIVWIAHDSECRRITGNRFGNHALRLAAGANASVTAASDERPSHFRVFQDGREIPGSALPIQMAARGHEILGAESEVIFHDGTSLHLFGNATPLFDKEGEPCGAVGAFVDVTARHAAQAELREREKRYRELADAMPQIVWTAGPDGVVDYCNRQWYEITGSAFTPGELESWVGLIHPDDLEACQSGWARAIQSTDPYEIEYRFFHARAGQYRWHLGRALPICDEHGQVARWFGTSTDIDDRKRAEVALRESESRLNLALDAAHMGIWDWDVLTGRLLWSPQNLRLFGYNDGEFNERYEGFRDRVHPDDIDALEAKTAEVLVSGEGFHSDFRVVWPDGQVRWIETKGGVVEKRGGRGTRVIGTAVDITERKLALEELARARDGLEARVRERTTELEVVHRAREEFTAVLARQARLIEISHEAIVIRTIEGTITFWNEGAERMYGWRKEEAVGRVIHELLGTHFPTSPEDVKEALFSRGTWDGELVHRRRDGSTLVVASRWVIDRERLGSNSSILEMNADITERRRAEAEAARERRRLSESVAELKLARERALETSRHKSEFLANMSHEIRTPMNGVIGMTSLLLETPLDHVQEDYVMTIRDSAHALLNIINDVLDFSKIEAGKMTLELDDFNLRTIMEEVADLVAPAAHEKNLALACLYPASLAEWYEGDSGRIRQVLLNLISNAVKFTSEGTVTMRARLIRRCGGRSTLRLSVIDTGIGIDAACHEIIFDSFTQADGSISRSFGGTGLGLSICRRLADLMGGKIGLKSHRGQGSEFWLELTLLDRPAPGATDRPLSRATEARRVHSTLRSATNENSVRHSATAGARVLVAEDNTTNQKVALRMLEKMGCHADAVSNGREALAMVNRIRYDLILMDVQMPEMDGYVATAEIRRLEKPQGRRVPIIAMTAHAMSGDRDCCLAAGMDDYISKPVAYDHLAGVLERWLAAGASAGQEEANQDASAPSPASQQAFVIDRLREIAAGDRDVERELVQTFVDDIESSLTAIQSALAQGDAVQAARLFHRLAGASGTMGADGLAVLCREAEQGALAGTFSVVTERLAEITRKSGEQRGSLLAHIAR